MELTTGAMLRHINKTPLSALANKLATIILDGIARKDRYNGLPRRPFGIKNSATRPATETNRSL